MRKVHKLFIEERIDKAKYDEVASLLRINASKEELKEWIDHFLLWMGGLFFITGVVFFFAYNWAEMHKFAKFGLVFAIIFSTTLIALVRPLSSIVSQVALFVAMVAIGIEWTLFGQIYQTGADAWNLFVAWSLFGIIIVATSTHVLHWLTWLVITHIALALFATQVLEFDGIETMIIMALFSAMIIALFYLLIHSYAMPHFRWLYDLNLAYFITLFTLILIDEFIGYSEAMRGLLLLYIPTIWLYLKQHNMIIVSLSVLSLIFVISSFFVMLAGRDVETKIVMGVLSLIVSSVVLINYLLKRIKDAKTH